MGVTEQKKISLIIPVYNVEKYVRKCLETAVCQTYRNYEIILVDDGSTDCSYQICDEYSRKNGHILLLHKENGGLASAWQCGVEASSGEYIAFLDSDDWVDPDYIKNLASGIELGADIVCCNKVLEYGSHSIVQKERTASGYYSRDILLKQVFPQMLNDGTYLGRRITPHRCGKLFKSSLIKNNIKYCDNKISFGEDLNIVLPCLADCKALLILEDEKGLYHYRQNRSSIARSYKPNMYEQISRLYLCLSRACTEKSGFDFGKQLDADFFCLFFEYVKNETKCAASKAETIKCVTENYQKMQNCISYDTGKCVKLKLSDRLLFFSLNNNIRLGIFIWFALYVAAKWVSREVDWKYLLVRKAKTNNVSGY
jgi:glycosyltransferase involved in cell wall biosynthesis